MLMNSSKKWLIWLISIAFILLSVVAIELLHSKQINFLQQESQSEAEKQLSVIRSRIESVIVSDMYLLNSLSTMVAVDPEGSFEAWNKIADNIMREGFNISIIGVARDDVLNFVYPLEGNESIVGADYRDSPEQWQSIRLAQDLGRTFISGPVNLFQGGRGLISRTPIFTDPPFNSNYWGVSSAVIDLDGLFEDIGVDELEENYQLAIRGANSSGFEGAIFHGSAKVFDSAFAMEQVSFPYGSWVLALAAKPDQVLDAPWYRTHIVRFICYSLLLLLSIAFLTIYRLYRIAHGRAMHDELTRLPNRRYFMFSLQQAFTYAKRKKRTDRFAVMNIDINKFKLINDTYGHAAGDAVLVECANRIKSVLRGSDLVARVGGDEFLILLPRVADTHCVSLISNKLSSVLSSEPVMYGDSQVDLHVTIGWAIYDQNFDGIDSLLKAADENMYQKKRQTHVA